MGKYICENSPVIQKIRQGCSKEFVDFERCLRENQDNPTSCSPHVARFVACAEAVDISGVGKSLMELSMVKSRPECKQLQSNLMICTRTVITLCTF